uniref:ABC transporter permease n=1 Tax=Desulfatirhabdium butyrativorans TaxID=340467 RepID=A0A7C4W041_9BACT
MSGRASTCTDSIAQRSKRIFSVAATSQVMMGILLVVTVGYLSLKSPYFFSWSNFHSILDHSSLNAIIAVGMTFVISGGGIDLSVGAIAALCGVIMAVLMHGNWGWQIVALLGIAAGFGFGVINGLVITTFRVNPFIVTLGTMSVMRGMALIITGGIPIYNFPQGFLWWGSGHIGPINPPMLVACCIACLGAILLNTTRFGRYTLALGGSEESLRRSGVNPSVYKVLVYGCCGLTAAIGGLIVTARLNTAEPLAATMFELEAIATVVLGGTTMSGGNGTILGTVLASLLLGILRNGLVILGIPSYYQQLLLGTIILVAVILSEWKASGRR